MAGAGAWQAGTGNTNAAGALYNLVFVRLPTLAAAAGWYPWFEKMPEGNTESHRFSSQHDMTGKAGRHGGLGGKTDDNRNEEENETRRRNAMRGRNEMSR